MMSKNASIITKILSTTTLLILGITILFSYKQFEDYKLDKEYYHMIEETMKKEQDMYIKTVLTENIKKAELLTEFNTNIIHNRLLEEYGDNLEGLENDILDPDPDSKINKILDEVLMNTYINKNTDSNRPIVATMRNIIWNRSLPIESEALLLWDNFKGIHYNTILAEKAIDAIRDMNVEKNDFIFWEMRHNSGQKDHTLLTSMNIDNLLDVYYKEGLNSLKGYELLVPVYITNSGDIFGTKDTNSIGEKINNYKIIVIQRINVYDALIDYKSDLVYINSEIEAIQLQLLYNDKHRISLLIQTIIFIFCLLIGSGLLQRRINSN